MIVPYFLALFLLVAGGLLTGGSADIIMTYDFGYAHLITFAVGVFAFLFGAHLMWLNVSE